MWVQNSSGVIASTLAGNFSVSGTMIFTSGGTLSMNFRLTGNGQSLPLVYSGPYSDGGYYINDNGAIDLVIERGDTLTVTNLSVSDGVWMSTVISGTKNLAKERAEEMTPGTTLPYGRSVIQAIGSEALAK